MKTFFISLSLLLFSCASYQSGNLSDVNKSEIKSELVVSGYLDQEYTTDHFTFIQVDFGNNTDEWIEIEKVLINNNDKDIKIILGEKLESYIASINQKIAIDRYNTSMILGVTAGVAAAGAISSGNDGSIESVKSYASIMAGSLIADDINHISNNLSDLERTRVLPRNHLISPFSVPPGLVSKRWILLQINPKYIISNFAFTAHFKDGSKKVYNINLK
jgi:hypothetical protein